MPILESYWDSLIQQFHHAQYCWANGLHTQGCHDVWVYGLFVLEAIVFLIFILVVSREITRFRAHKRYLKKLADREKLADPETMSQAMWKGDETVAQHTPEEVLANEIRQAVTKQTQMSAQQISEEAYFEMAADEVKNKTMKPGLWAKAFSDADGNDTKAQAIYLKLRVAALKDETKRQQLPAGEP